MKRTPVYSKSTRSRRASGAANSGAANSGAVAREAAFRDQVDTQSSQAVARKTPRFARTRALIARHERLFLVASSVLLSALLFFGYGAMQPPHHDLTQRELDAAVKHTLEKNVFRSVESRAFERIQPSVVHILQSDGRGGEEEASGHVGTGVVIVDKGLILTSLHVVSGKEGIKVRFANGAESEAAVVQRQPENDLAVLQAKTVPDHLVPATLRSTQGLAVGDKVVAVGFPFNIGPSASSGIVSGLKRNYESPEHDQTLLNLIQFDAAANPGNSGGPLITMDGEVVGIVTAILSPHRQGTFIGIGFAVPIEVAASLVGESPF